MTEIDLNFMFVKSNLVAPWCHQLTCSTKKISFQTSPLLRTMRHHRPNRWKLGRRLYDHGRRQITDSMLQHLLLQRTPKQSLRKIWHSWRELRQFLVQSLHLWIVHRCANRSWSWRFCTGREYADGAMLEIWLKKWWKINHCTVEKLRHEKRMKWQF